LYFLKPVSVISDWKVMYENSPREMVKMFGLDWSVYGDLVLGGEAAMWSEQVRTDFLLDTRKAIIWLCQVVEE
jgi:hypothetical protein